MQTKLTEPQLRSLISESHRRQLADEDYQKVAVEIGQRIGLDLDNDKDADI